MNKEDKKLKDMATMTAGVTVSKLEAMAFIDLHGHSAHITHTDAEDTMVQYANLERRTFDTHVLNSFLELKTFPVGTEFTRPTAHGTERAVIEAVTGDCCYQVQLTDDANDTSTPTLTYAQLIQWHMGKGKPVSARKPTPPAHYPPTVEEIQADSLRGDDERDGDSNPFEDDLKAANERLNKELELAEINGQSRINALLLEVAALNADLLKQHDLHTTELVAKNEQIARLEQKAAILTPTARKFRIIYGVSEAELEKATLEGWQFQHTQFIGEAGSGQLNVLLSRDIPAEPAPKLLVTEAAAAIYSTPVISPVPPVTPRPPVRQPPMPANQTIVPQQMSRPLTNNVSRTSGETKRIPTLAEIQARREKNNAEIDAIIERGLAEQEALRRQFAQSTSPFNRIGAQ